MSKNNLKPQVKIEFLDKSQFIAKMKQLNYSNYLVEIIRLKNKNQDKTLETISSLEDFLRYKKSTEDITNKIKEFLLFDYDSEGINKQNYYADLCGLCEEIIKSEFGDSITEFINENKKSLLNILSHVEGFFNESEFGFLEWQHNGIQEKEEKKSKNENESEIYNLFIEYYGNFYTKVITALKEKGIVSENNYSKKISLNNDDNMLNLLPLCLQVKEKKSLTGIVDYVYISDMVSDEYTFIMDDLKISSLKLIDTYGLDHANWDDDKENVLEDIIYDLVEKRIIYFDASLAVAYVKKLDSGKPTELKSILPKIYNIIPQAPVYCIFNGLDIFLDSRISQFQSCESFYSSVKKPKALAYLYSECGKNAILDSVKGEEEVKENLYSTLKNNIVSFCSNKNKINRYYPLYENNIKQIYKLLLSVCMKEYSSMNIIPKQIICEVEQGKYDSEINDFIRTVFEKSSMCEWENIHHRTFDANYNRIVGGTELGYWGTYKHRWNQLFHIGYVRTVTEDETKWLKKDEQNNKKEYAFKACIKNMENIFLGPAYRLVNIHLDKEDREYSQENDFRGLIEEMYSLGVKQEIYKFNPFKKDECKNLEMSEKKEKMVELLNNVFDFEKGYNLIKEKLVEHFKNCLLITIDNENKAKAENLLKINYSFYVQYQKLMYDFNKKYKTVSFDDMMKYINHNLTDDK